MNTVRRIKIATATFLRELNFYTKNSTDPFEIRNGCLSTRLYIIILMVVLVTLSIYTLSDEQIRQIVVIAPTLKTFMDMGSKFGKDNLFCPCNEVSIGYNSFMAIELVFHPVCSSHFIEESWFDFLKPFETLFSRPAEFSVNAFYQFQFVAQLCKLAKSTNDDALQQFYQTKWVTSKMIPQEVVEPAAMELIRTQISTTINTFRRSANFGLLIPKYQALSSFFYP